MQFETTVRQRLRKVMTFRKMTVPSEPCGFHIRSLGHSTFAAETRAFLRVLLSESKASLLPFHVPKVQIGFKAHPKVKDILLISKSWLSSGNLTNAILCLVSAKR